MKINGFQTYFHYMCAFAILKQIHTLNLFHKSNRYHPECWLMIYGRTHSNSPILKNHTYIIMMKNYDIRQLMSITQYEKIIQHV